MITISFNKALPKKLKSVLENETNHTIQTEVDECTQGSEFLMDPDQEENESAAFFNRREIKLGLHLGEGTFSDVYEVTRFKLKYEVPLNSAATRARLHCQDAAAEAGEQGSCRYAIKIPKHPERKEFFRKDKKKSDCEGEPLKFQYYTRACIDLIMEGKYLAALDHPNIIKVRGMSSGPSPFIIVDYLTDTLDKRIEQWRQARHPREPLRRSSSSSSWGKTSSAITAPFRRAKTSEAKTSETKIRSSSFRRCKTFEGRLVEEFPALGMFLFQEKTEYALQIAEALKYLHDRRLIMRDLKPSNIGFLKGEDGKDTIKLFDFGLCRELPEPRNGEESFRMSVAGTLRYMDPCMVNEGCYGLKADVYSWSIVVYEMMTLEKPYASVCATPELHRRFVCRDGVRPGFPRRKQGAPMVPPCLQKTLESAWSHDAKDRPTMAEVTTQLKDFMNKHYAVDDDTAVMPVKKAQGSGAQITLADALSSGSGKGDSECDCESRWPSLRPKATARTPVRNQKRLPEPLRRPIQ